MNQSLATAETCAIMQSDDFAKQLRRPARHTYGRGSVPGILHILQEDFVK